MPSIFKYILSSIFVAFFLAVFNGIVGNRADATFLKILPFLQENISLTRWQVVSICMIFIVVAFIPLGLIALRYYYSQQAAINLVKLDDSLLRLLASFKQNPDRQVATRLLFHEFLEDTLELFKDGCRISILRPDDNKPEFLTIWQSLRAPIQI